MKTQDIIVVFLYRILYTAVWLLFIAFLIDKFDSYKPLWLLAVYILTLLSVESKGGK